MLCRIFIQYTFAWTITKPLSITMNCCTLFKFVVHLDSNTNNVNGELLCVTLLSKNHSSSILCKVYYVVLCNSLYI